ncbi:ergothioneine biosynthesis protein EgtB [Cryomorphaceae bacterium 1068]|nr:ergothioneine biosynthesis protein EgtB [Cryomorphaceae bacterium 1068]
MESITETKTGESTTAPKPLSMRFLEVRNRTYEICKPLKTEDYPVQPVTDVSPPKWHLAHTTWFFETFALKEFDPNYQEFDPTFGFHFNSYYNNVGERVQRSNRGAMTRPETARIFEYRKYVNEKLIDLLSTARNSKNLYDVIELGLQHEMQHQELLLTDIKYILGHQPFFPCYRVDSYIDRQLADVNFDWVKIESGLKPIGYEGDGFFFDNEKGSHQVYLEEFSIANRPITFGEYIEFIESGGYQDFNLWHSDAWEFIDQNGIVAPLFVHKIDGEWQRYTLSGLQKIKGDEILVHVSYYEAAAFAQWKGFRLPTEFEWEVASEKFNWGQCWEWTNSAYLPYPRFAKAPGALGEYNGKFMINQMVLRGASGATAPGHSRKTYRNFFHPHLQWQFAGIRLAK